MHYTLLLQQQSQSQLTHSTKHGIPMSYRFLCTYIPHKRIFGGFAVGGVGLFFTFFFYNLRKGLVSLSPFCKGNGGSTTTTLHTTTLPSRDDDAAWEGKTCGMKETHHHPSVVGWARFGSVGLGWEWWLQARYGGIWLGTMSLVVCCSLLLDPSS